MNTNDLYRRGMSAYDAGRFAEAIDLLGPLTRGMDATALLSRFYLGQAHYQQGVQLFQRARYAEARPHFEKAAGLNPYGGGVERFLAAGHARAGRLNRAGPDLDALLQRDPCDVNVRVRLALTQWKRGQAAEALATIDDGLRLRPDAAELHYQRGVLLAGWERYAEAQACFDAALACDPHHVAAHERLAQCCGVLGQPEHALQILRQASHLDPGNARLMLQINMLTGQLASRGLPTQPPAPAAHRSKLDESAIQQLGQLVIEEPDFITAFLSLPASEVDAEVFSALAATLERALDCHPEYADLHRHCGEVYRRLGRTGQAIAHAERAVQINPRYVSALILLAQLYAQTEQWADGATRLEEVIHAGGDYADVHYLLGRLYQRTGRPYDARHAFDRALALNSNYQPARDALTALEMSV